MHRSLLIAQQWTRSLDATWLGSDIRLELDVWHIRNGTGLSSCGRFDQYLGRATCCSIHQYRPAARDLHRFSAVGPRQRARCATFNRGILD